MISIRKAVAAAGAASILAFGSALPAFAEDDPAATYTGAGVVDSVQVSKTIKANASIAVNDTFTFKFTAADLSGEAMGHAAADAPTIENKALSFTKADLANGEATKTTKFLPAATAYTKGPGVYGWVIEEVAGTNDNITYNAESDKYIVKVKLVEGTSGLEYDTVVVKDYSATTEGDKTPPEFVNLYKNKTHIDVHKTVQDPSGVLKGADPEYTFTATITNPTNCSENPQIALDGGQGTECTYAAATGVTTCTFKLKDGGNATLNNVPTGATYSVAENVPSGAGFHIETTTAAWDSTDATRDGGGSSAANLTAEDTDNDVTILNVYDDVELTGLALQTLPYVVLIGMPVIGLGAYAVLRRKA